MAGQLKTNGTRGPVGARRWGVLPKLLALAVAAVAVAADPGDRGGAAAQERPAPSSFPSGPAGTKESALMKLAEKDPITVRAIRWDAWFDSDASRRRYQNNFLKDPKWHAWLPFFARLISDKQVEVFADRQEVMDQEIAYAKAGGLSHWAFLYYRPGVASDRFDHDKMSIGRRLCLSSRHKADINFCLIIYPCDGAEWRGTVADAIACAKEPTYQTVLAGRPLLYLLAWGDGPERWAAEKDHRGSLHYLRGQFKQAGLGNPYVVVQAIVPTKAATYVDGLGLDAISSYAVWGGEGYPGLARVARALWDSSAKTGKPVVPLATAGWGGPHGGVPQQPTGPELAEHMRDAIGWIDANRSAAPARTILFYAWNEFDEGGHLAPTKGQGTARLDALAEVLKGRGRSTSRPMRR